MTTQPRRSDRILRKDGWELRMYYRMKGTRSEGLHGVLLHEGKLVEAKEEGEVVQTPLGEMKYYGALNHRLPWEPTGWNFTDPKKIRPSWSLAEGDT